MRSARHNVSTWNLTTRELAIDASGKYVIGEEPLGFYHFTGFDSGAHHVMAAKNAAGNHAVEALVRWYTNETKKLAKDPLAKEQWAFGTFSDGTLITKAQRLVYRERPDLQEAFPDPFDATGYLFWWKTQGRMEYADLFDEDRQAEALAKLSTRLTPGFGARDNHEDGSKVGRLIRQLLTEPGTGARLGKRGWGVLRTEGVSGIKRRLID